MTFEEILDQAIAMLQRRGRVTYRMLKRQFQLDDDTLADLLAELRYAHREAISEDEQGMAWTGGAAVASGQSLRGAQDRRDVPRHPEAARGAVDVCASGRGRTDQ